MEIKGCARANGRLQMIINLFRVVMGREVIVILSLVSDYSNYEPARIFSAVSLPFRNHTPGIVLLESWCESMPVTSVVSEPMS